MFRKNGRKRFDLCPHKIPTLSTAEGELNCPRTVETRIKIYINAGAHADESNVCMDTDNEWMYESPANAMDELGIAAGALICGTCPYYELTPTEVANEIADNAEAQIKIDTAQAKAADAKAELLAAQSRELNEQITFDGLQRLFAANPTDIPREESPGS